MPTIDLTNLTQTLDANTNGTADFASYVLHGSTYYTWLTASGHTITASGTGITVDGSNIPTAGTIDTVTIDLGNNNPGTPDVVISGLSFDLTDLVYTLGASSADAFWATVMAGETTVLPGVTDEITLYGDFRDFDQGGLGIAADDTLTGGDFQFTFIYGDTETVVSGLLLGGDDLITGTFASAYGDAQTVSAGARLVGGDDQIIYQINWTASRTVAVSADALNVWGTVIGGDDLIDARAVSTLDPAYFYGDASSVQSDGLVEGGNDTIFGSQFNDEIYGDAARIFADGVLIGGDDALYGGDGDDSIAGEAAHSIGIIIGGNDSLFGGNGNDFMHGDVANALSEGGNDYLNGERGNDSLFGNEGNDMLLGGANEDSLVGGDGNDSLYGENGRDTLSGGTGDDLLFGDNGTDLLFGDGGNDTLSGDIGDDTLHGGANEDHLEGGLDNDSLHGDNGHDTLFGNGGNDTLFGGNADDLLYGGANEDLLLGEVGNDDLRGDNGHDTLLGDTGTDMLTGGNGHDSLSGGADSDVFVFVDGFGSDTITDFDAFDDAEDIDLSGVAAITDFADLTNAGSPHMTQVGADVVIDDFGGNTITVLNVTLGDMNAADFVF